ncbi:TPA: tRNA lysidine(34) synthetase TilS [Staphylococcus aureus]|nr:tRNA lysidine(34) synthetase TilS [Staphylococcus aureus]
MQLNSNGWHVDDHIVVAVSTGIDSMCLLYQLLNDYKDSYRKLTCLHVNHGVRSASIEEARFLEAYCERHHIDLHIKKLDLSHSLDRNNSIQNEARIKRYEWFDEMMNVLEADVLLTAHHLDDQLETIMYRIFNGKSTRNKLGFDELSKRKGYQIYRPLLAVSKKEIKQFQERYHIPYFEDESNKDNRYIRNDIRNRIIPAIDENNQLKVSHLLKLKQWHDEQYDILQYSAKQFIQEFVKFDEQSKYLEVSRQAFNNLPNSLKMVVLDCLLSKYYELFNISAKTYEEWFKQFSSKKAQFSINLTDKWIIQIAYGKLIIMAKNNGDTYFRVQTIKKPGNYFFNKYRLEIHSNLPKCLFPLTVRTRQSGDTFKLNGRDGYKKVNRLFIDCKVPQWVRDQMPIVLDKQQRIIAVGDLYQQQTIKKWIIISKNGDE